MTRLGRSPAPWLLGGIAIVLVGVVAAGTVVERDPPASATAPAGEGWAAGPTFAGATPGTAGPDGAAAGSAGPSGATSGGGPAGYVFPVGGKATYARTHHDYPAADIISDCGSPFLSVTDGVVLEVSRYDSYNTNADDGATRGGLFVSVLGDDGVRYYGSHLRMILPAIVAKARVTAGQKVGEVGDTGDAGVCHLHFGISSPCARTGDWWIRRGVIWPWSYLDAWQKREARSPVPEITSWTTQNGCPAAPAA